MSDVKFTPGPWVADIRGGCLAVYPESREDDTPGLHADDDRNIHYSSKGSAYVENPGYWDMDDQARANAHLIAAAPDLYEMLEIAVKDAEQGYSEWIDSAKAALSKARGETTTG